MRGIRESIAPFVTRTEIPDAPVIKALANVEHLYTPVRATLKPGVRALDVARALHQRGHVVTIQQAFDRYLGRGRPAFVEKALPSLRSVADLVHARGGVVSAAHLKSFGTLANLTVLQAEGLDAVETRHPSHHGDFLATITDAALVLGLARTGGSDWHGERDAAGTHAQLGSQQVPDEWLVELRARRPTPTGLH